MSMKIGGGEFKGRPIHAPKGSLTRPTSGRLKKSLFDVLVATDRLDGARVLDVFAGAGGLGLEALSRGAAEVLFVEQRRKACESIRANLKELGLTGRGEVLQKDVRTALQILGKRGLRFDLVFADPPYRASKPLDVLVWLGSGELLAPGALVVVEHHHKSEPREGYQRLTRTRVIRTGESCLSLFELAR